MHLHIHHHADQRVVDKLDMILATQEILMDSIDRIVADVTAQSTEIESLKAFIVSLKNQIADALSGTTLPPAVEARLAAIFPPLEANTQAIADAIAATPAPPAATPADPAPADPAPASDLGAPKTMTDPNAPTT